MTKLNELNCLGQAAWFDYIRRSFLTSGELKKWVDMGIRGVTSNPAIFEQAIAGNDDYDMDIKEMAQAGKTVTEIYEALALHDIRLAADILRPVYDESMAEDGYVSLEVNPELANDTENTIAEAKRLFAALNRPNVMIKIPATPAGVPAIESAISQGVNINVTLIFSLSQYEKVAKAYIAGLEKLQDHGGDLTKVASVASFFVSRVDSAVDPLLAEKYEKDLQGTIAVANAKLAYEHFQKIFSDERWQSLKEAGARVQRPLWASTGTKNPEYSDTLYVDTLIGKNTVNTMPPKTLDAFLDHGVTVQSVENDLAGAKNRLMKLAELNIDLELVTEKLQKDGVDAFVKPFKALMISIAEKREKMLA